MAVQAARVKSSEMEAAMAMVDRLYALTLGKELVYHEGYLASDRGEANRTPEQVAIDYVAQAALKLEKRGHVHLVQKRLGEGRWQYIAIGRKWVRK